MTEKNVDCNLDKATLQLNWTKAEEEEQEVYALLMLYFSGRLDMIVYEWWIATNPSAKGWLFLVGKA